MCACDLCRFNLNTLLRNCTSAYGRTKKKQRGQVKCVCSFHCDETGEAETKPRLVDEVETGTLSSRGHSRGAVSPHLATSGVALSVRRNLELWVMESRSRAAQALTGLQCRGSAKLVLKWIAEGRGARRPVGASGGNGAGWTPTCLGDRSESPPSPRSPLSPSCAGWLHAAGSGIW